MFGPEDLVSGIEDINGVDGIGEIKAVIERIKRKYPAKANDAQFLAVEAAKKLGLKNKALASDIRGIQPHYQSVTVDYSGLLIPADTIRTSNQTFTTGYDRCIGILINELDNQRNGPPLPSGQKARWRFGLRIKGADVIQLTLAQTFMMSNMLNFDTGVSFPSMGKRFFPIDESTQLNTFEVLTQFIDAVSVASFFKYELTLVLVKPKSR